MKRKFFLILILILIFLFSVIKGEAEESLPDLFISTTLSKALPKQGDSITIKAKVHHQGEKPVSEVVVCFFQEDKTGELIPLGEKHLVEEIKANNFVTLTQRWSVPKNSFYKIWVVIDPDNKIKEKDESNNKDYFEVPVVAKELHFHYWSCPKSTRYVTIKMLIEKEEIDYWRERGVIPAAWKAGFCNAKWSEEQFVDSWSSAVKEGFPAIAIDEFGEGAPVDRRMDSALIKTKEKCPDLFITLWTPGLGGTKEATEAYKKGADLVLIEKYISSFASYYDFDSQWEMVKKIGIANKTLFTLGFGRWITTEQELLRQIKYIKKLSPEMPGLSFFSSAPDYLLEFADRFCYDYFIKPVIWVENISSGKATITNIGGMDAEEIKINFFSKKPEEGGGEIGSKRIESLKAGEERIIEISSETKHLLIVPSEHYTVLD